MEGKASSELHARLEEAQKEIASYKSLSEKAEDLRLRETEELSELVVKLKETEQELEKARTELERRVEERTAELSRANATLEHEVSGRRQAVEALRRSEQRFRTIAEATSDWIWEIDEQAVYTYVNPKVRDLLGYEPGEVIGKKPFHFMPREEIDRISKLFIEIAEAGKPFANLENVNLHKDGRRIILETNGVPIFDDAGNLRGYRGIDRDITDRKREEEELLRSQKLESLGVLAGGIAHDFNNLLAMVQGYIDLVLLELPPNHVSRQRLLAALQNIDQTKDLTNRLITFSRGGGPIREIFDVKEIIRDAVHATVKNTAVNVMFDFMENLWPVEVDELQVKQVFYNLTANAGEAMPEGGNLTIKAENTLITADEILNLKEGTYLKITFTDNGVGIPEEHLLKIFDPYFTTKEMATQKGMGLGLAVCYSILKKHSGHITATSQAGKGSSFVLYLPARQDQPIEVPLKKRESTGKVRVLIMDDEPHVREIERAYLEWMGYEVTDVKDGQEAIDTYKEALDANNRFDLVLMDLTVRQGLGGQLAMERLRRIDPAIRAIIASGYVDDDVIKNYSHYGFHGALTKPFKGEDMKNLVERILCR